jgi:pimeloyl-ACP methyl ester carboxylesterase
LHRSAGAPSVPLTHRTVGTGGRRLHLVEAGRGPAVVLLHGFPDSWYSWRRQLDILSEHHRVLAFDLPGFNESDPLERPGDYRPDLVANRFAAAMQEVGPAAVVGHDWGGMVAWWLAVQHPELVDMLVVVNCPHPVLTSHISWRDPLQLVRSWYVGVLRLPGLGPALARLGLPVVLRLIVRSAPERRVCMETLRRSGLREPLRYYRHLGARTPWPDGVRLPPTLLIWGERDPFLSARLARLTQQLAPSVQLLRVPRGGHWVHQRRPDVVNRAICRFLQVGRVEGGGRDR